MVQNQNMGNSDSSRESANDEIVNLRLGHVFAAITACQRLRRGEPSPRLSLITGCSARSAFGRGTSVAGDWDLPRAQTRDVLLDHPASAVLAG